MSHNFTPASIRRPEFDSYSDADIQNQYAAADARYKTLILAYDLGKATDADLVAVDALCARLDDELCARGY